jgi:hypothetical protein
MSKNFSYIPFMNIDDHLNAHYCEHESLTPNYSNENIVVPLSSDKTKGKQYFNSGLSFVKFHK